MLKDRIAFSLAAAVFMTAVMAIAESRHPNISAAQQLLNQAIDRISAAQVANEYDMHGHARKAKVLLRSRWQVRPVHPLSGAPDARQLVKQLRLSQTRIMVPAISKKSSGAV